MEAGLLAPSLPALCTFQTARSTFATRNHRLGTLAHEIGTTAVAGRSAEGKKIPARGLHHLRATAASVGIPGYFDDLIPEKPPPAPEPGSGSFSRPVRKPLPPAPPAHLPRCGHCLEVGHYTSQCPRREAGPVRANGAI